MTETVLLEPTHKQRVKSRPLSAQLYEEACMVIPQGVNSPVRAFPGLEQTPLVVDSGYGDAIVDVDGNRYIDFCNSWGALIHGYAHPRIVEAAQRRVAQGSTFGTTTAIEGKIAKKVVESIPSIEKVRFVSSGTESTMSAIRLARGFTGRELIIKFTGNFHGHADAFLVQAGSGCVHLSSTSSSAGVPEAFIEKTLCLPYNDIEGTCQALRARGKEVAAVIVEPIAANMGVIPPVPGFLEMLREETTKQGIVLIFDEVITGFRVALGGAQALYGITPDLTCLGKIIGGGFPAAAFGGSAEIMDYLAPSGPVYQSGTLSGNPVAMEAGLETLNLLAKPGFYAVLEEKTRLITEPIKEYLKKRSISACVQDVPGMFTLFFGATAVHNFEEGKNLDGERFKHFFRFLFENGVYFSPSPYEAQFLSAAHTPAHLTQTHDLLLEFLNTLY